MNKATCYARGYLQRPTCGTTQFGWDFQVNVTTGGLDALATIFGVVLLPADQASNLTLAGGTNYLPRDSFILAADSKERYGRTLSFARRTWAVKEAPLPVGPGPNRFSSDPNDVWVDGNGKLHLTIHQRDSDWFCTEVFLTESLGYGKYLFQTSSRVDALDSKAVFGIFTWDGYGDPSLPAGRQNREIDFEDSRWDNPANSNNSQFVVQPWDTPGNRNQFQLPDLSADAKLTRILTWKSDQLHFIVVRGHHTFDDYSPSDIVTEWTYGGQIPQPGQERWRFNLWLINGSNPAGNGELEVVVDDFQFSPEP